jgi:hypothetical protein
LRSHYAVRIAKVRLGSSTKELYYSHISAVEFSPPIFKLMTPSGPIVCPISDNPDVGEAALNAVRQRLRKIHITAS